MRLDLLSGRLRNVQEAADKEYEFSSIQFNLPKEMADKVISWGKRIDNKDLASDGREDNIHITVKYGLYTTDLDEVKEVLNKMEPFDITLGEVSAFDSEEHRVLKIDVSSDKLHAANKIIKSSLENEETHPKYIPHVTIAYVKPDTCDDLLGNTDFSGMKMRVDNLVFSSKDGEQIPIKL